MNIEELVYSYGGSTTHGADFWPYGALDPNERIIELPSARDIETFISEVNRLLDDNNPVQHIATSNDGTAEFLLYYANAVLDSEWLSAEECNAQAHEGIVNYYRTGESPV